MSSATRRPSLPGADELFRSTGPAPSAPVSPQGSAAELLERSASLAEPALTVVPAAGLPAAASRPAAGRPSPRDQGDRSPTGREKHDKKITVYLSPEELVDLERARLTLAADHGLYIDRGRIVREALAVVIADLEDKSGASILVRRLHGG